MFSPVWSSSSIPFYYSLFKTSSWVFWLLLISVIKGKKKLNRAHVNMSEMVCFTHPRLTLPVVSSPIQFCMFPCNWQAMFQVSWLAEYGAEIAVYNTEEGVYMGCDWDTHILTEELCSIWQVYKSFSGSNFAF